MNKEVHPSGRAPDPAREKWMARLRSLDEDTQRYIAKKYYGGKMPWRERK